MTTTKKPDFGFGAHEPDLGDFTPLAPAPRPTPLQQRALDLNAAVEGFTSRTHDAPVRYSKRRRIEGIPTKPFYVRCDPSEVDRFDRLAGANGLGRADFLTHLMNLFELRGR